MRRTVLITIPGDAKREFANSLHDRIDGGLELVIIQKPRRRSLLASLRRFYSRAKGRLISELWYGLLLRLDRKVTAALEYFRHHPRSRSAGPYRAHILAVEDVNSDEVSRALGQIKPDLLVVWGSTILKPHIVGAAGRAINLHFGYCPHYRGALANQYAALRGDFDKIGATIHYVNGKPDAGDILSVIAADPTKPPQEMFRDLNERAIDSFLDISECLHRGEELPRTPQDISSSHNFLLRSWLPSVRYSLGRRLLEREATY